MPGIGYNFVSHINTDEQSKKLAREFTQFRMQVLEVLLNNDKMRSEGINMKLNRDTSEVGNVLTFFYRNNLVAIHYENNIRTYSIHQRNAQSLIKAIEKINGIKTDLKR